jgi:hypothetical protein
MGLPSEQGERFPASLPTRWLAALVLLFLADAAQLLLLLPDRTGELFAWPIQPAVNAGILASAYVGGSYFFIRVLTRSPWHLVAYGFAPVTVFVWFAGVATLLHLDRLSGGTMPRVTWIAVYVVAPLLVPAAFLANRSRFGSPPVGPRLVGGVRVALGASGSAMIVLAMVAFVAPEAAIDVLPWPATLLTMRVLATVCALYGTVGVAVALRPDAAGSRIPLEGQMIGLVVALIAIARGQAEIDWESAVAPVIVTAIAGVLAIGVVARVSASEREEFGRPDVRWQLAGLLVLAAAAGALAAAVVAAVV